MRNQETGQILDDIIAKGRRKMLTVGSVVAGLEPFAGALSRAPANAAKAATSYRHEIF